MPGQELPVEPVRDRRYVRKIRAYFQETYKLGNLYALIWTCGVNLGLRAGDVRQLTYGVLTQNGPISFTEQKNGTQRVLYVNNKIRSELDAYMLGEGMIFVDSGSKLFLSQKGTVDDPIAVPTIHRLIKEACTAVGLKGNYGSHSMRKTFGYHAYMRSRTQQNLNACQRCESNSNIYPGQILKMP